MIQTKLTKLAKRLKIFTFEEFLVMSGEEEQTVKNFLDRLLDAEILEKNRQNSYKYNEFIPAPTVNKIKTKIMKSTLFSPAEIKKLEDERDSFDSYKNAPEHIKKMVDKYLAVLKASNNRGGKRLYDFIYNDWNKKHPDMKTSVTAFSRTKRLLKTYGLAGIIPSTISLITMNTRIDENIYKKCRAYILKNKEKSLKYNYIKFKAEYLPEI